MHNNGIWTKNFRKEQFLGLHWSLIRALECNPNNCSSSMFVDIIMCQWWSLITYETISLTGLARRALLGLQKSSKLHTYFFAFFGSPKTCSLGASVTPKIVFDIRLGSTTQKYRRKYFRSIQILYCICLYSSDIVTP